MPVCVCVSVCVCVWDEYTHNTRSHITTSHNTAWFGTMKLIYDDSGRFVIRCADIKKEEEEERQWHRESYGKYIGCAVIWSLDGRWCCFRSSLIKCVRMNNKIVSVKRICSSSTRNIRNIVVNGNGNGCDYVSLPSPFSKFGIKSSTLCVCAKLDHFTLENRKKKIGENLVTLLAKKHSTIQVNSTVNHFSGLLFWSEITKKIRFLFLEIIEASVAIWINLWLHEFLNRKPFEKKTSPFEK